MIKITQDFTAKLIEMQHKIDMLKSEQSSQDNDENPVAKIRGILPPPKAMKTIDELSYFSM